MFSGRTFQPRLLPTLAALLGIALTAWLGGWQLSRAAEKLLLQQRLELGSGEPPIQLETQPVRSEDVVYRRVEARGEFLEADTVYVDNRTRDGIAGYEVVTPLRIEGGTRYVLVNRGWAPARASRSELPDVATPSGSVKVEGTALPGDPRIFELSKQVRSGRVWQNVTVERYREAFGLPLQPIIVHAQSDLGDGLRRDWPRPDVGIDRHRAYAFQWFAMAAAILVFYVVATLKRKPAAPA